MKKLLITFLGSVFCMNVQAQLINPGFETWTNDLAAPAAMNPNSGNGTTGWWDYNMFHSSFAGASPISVFRCDTAHTGLHAARVETVIYTAASYSLCSPWGTPFIGHPYLDTLGILFNGNTNETTVRYVPGIPFTQKIDQFTFWYRYKPNGVDTAECRVLLVNQRNPVAGGSFKTTLNTGSTWQQATITMTYISSLTPDTLYVLFSSSSLDKNPKPGSVFWIDDVSVTILAGVENVAGKNESIAGYPNPASNQINIQSAKELGIISIYNSLGEVVLQTSTRNTNEQIDISKFLPGIYTIHAQGKYMKLVKE